MSINFTPLKNLLNEKQFWQLQFLNLLKGLEVLTNFAMRALALFSILGLLLIQKGLFKEESKVVILELLAVIIIIIIFIKIIIPTMLYFRPARKKGKLLNFSLVMYLMYLYAIQTLMLNAPSVSSVGASINHTVQIFFLFLIVFFSRKIAHKIIFRNLNTIEELKRWTPFMKKIKKIDVEVKNSNSFFPSERFSTNKYRKIYIFFKYSNIFIIKHDFIQVIDLNDYPLSHDHFWKSPENILRITEEVE